MGIGSKAEGGMVWYSRVDGTTMSEPKGGKKERRESVCGDGEEGGS